jgi:MFS family permease
LKPPVDRKSLFRALRYRNYRLYFTGQGVSLVGSWMQSVAMGWLVYRLTRSAFLLGAVGFASQIPSFFLGPLAGVLADRWNRHRMMVVIQSLFMVQASVLAALVLTGRIGVPSILGLSLALGLVMAFDMPVRQSFVVQMLDRREDLGNAIALNSMMFNGARLVGPSVAGLVVAAAGEGVCFLVNAVSFTAVIASLLAMKTLPPQAPAERPSLLGELKKGFSYAYGFLPIRAVLSTIAMVSLLGMSFHVLLPVFAKEILGGGPHTLGFLMGATGVGALAGAVTLASRRSASGLEALIPAAGSLFGAALVALSFSRAVPLSLGLMTLVGYGMMVFMVSSNTLLQTLVDEGMRGRIMALYTMAFMGMTPLGSLLAGAAAGRIGAPHAVAVGGAACVAVTAAYARNLPAIRRAVRPVFRERGIIPDLPAGVDSATEIAASVDS